MKFEKLQEMIDLVGVVQAELEKDCVSLIPSTSLEIETTRDNALVRVRYMRPEIVAALVTAGFSVKICGTGATVSFRNKE